MQFYINTQMADFANSLGEILCNLVCPASGVHGSLAPFQVSIGFLPW